MAITLSRDSDGGILMVNIDLDRDYDIGPGYYNFCESRHFGAPSLRHHLRPVYQNVTIIEKTTNITNISVHKTVNKNIIYNGGPDYERISRKSERPIPKLRVERVRERDSKDRTPKARDGTLQVNGDAFTKALANDPAAIDGLFSTPGSGVAAALGQLVERYNHAETGVLTTRKDGLSQTIERLADDIARKTASLDLFRQTLVRQFTALEQTVSKFNAIGQFLDQQEAAREKK